MIIKRLFLCGCIGGCLSWGGSLKAQEDSLRRIAKSFGGHASVGYQVTLSLPHRRVRRAYWHYLSGVASLTLKRNHWVLYTHLGQEQIPMYAHVEPNDQGVALYLGVPAALADASGAWEEEVIRLLFLFRWRFYRDELERLLTDNEKAYATTSKYASLLDMRRVRWQKRVDRYEQHPRLDKWQRQLRSVNDELQSVRRELYARAAKRRMLIEALSKMEE